MNQPRSPAIRVLPEHMQSFVRAVAAKVGISDPQAELLSRLLVANDLRGVLSHGSIQLVRYVREIRSRGINPRPAVSVVRETPTSLLLDGDFGLGYFPAHEGTLQAIDKAERHGMAAVVTRHHGHIGAAGTYARMTLRHDLLTFVTSGVQLNLRPGDLVTAAAGGSPMSFSAPALLEPAFVLDCGVTHDIQGDPPHRDELVRLAPGLVLRAIGFGTVCQVWAGLLAGLSVDVERPPRDYNMANQGFMLFTFKLSLFVDVEQFKREMDEYVRCVRRLKPLEGTQGAFLPGGIEASLEETYRRDGIPLSESHQQHLERLAADLGISRPWT